MNQLTMQPGADKKNGGTNFAYLKVSRSFKSAEFGKIVSTQLHSMSDASTCGYGQCSYLGLENESGKVHVSFVMGKARVTPRKTVSIDWNWPLPRFLSILVTC